VVRNPRIVVRLLLVALAMAACSGGGKQATMTDFAASSPSQSETSTSSSQPGALGPTASDAPSAGDIPDSQVFVPFIFNPGSYSLKVPEGWSRTSAADGSIRFTDNFNAIDLGVTPADSAPSVQSALNSEVPVLQATTPGFELGNVSTVERQGGKAITLAYHALSPPNSVTGKTITLSVERYEFWHAGNEAIVTLSGPLNADNVDPWRTVTDSFAWS
jgi:hypothetical protein